MSDERGSRLAEAFSNNLKTSYLNGYHDGRKGKPCDIESIMRRGRESLLGEAYKQGWLDGDDEANDDASWTSSA